MRFKVIIDGRTICIINARDKTHASDWAEQFRMYETEEIYTEEVE